LKLMNRIILSSLPLSFSIFINSKLVGEWNQTSLRAQAANSHTSKNNTQ